MSRGVEVKKMYYRPHEGWQEHELRCLVRVRGEGDFVYIVWGRHDVMREREELWRP